MRKTVEYRGCKIIPQSGPSQYFGHPDYPRVKTQYRKHWYRVEFPQGGYVLEGRLSDAKLTARRADQARRANKN